MATEIVHNVSRIKTLILRDADSEAQIHLRDDGEIVIMTPAKSDGEPTYVHANFEDASAIREFLA